MLQEKLTLIFEITAAKKVRYPRYLILNWPAADKGCLQVNGQI